MYQSRERSVIAVLILTFITCGIYTLFWIYQTSSDLDEVSEDYYLNPGIALLLTIITCGLYGFYWYYQANRMLVNAKRKITNGYPNDNYLVYLLLIIFGFSWVAMLILQSDLNDLWGKLSERHEADDYTKASANHSKSEKDKWNDF